MGKGEVMVTNGREQCTFASKCRIVIQFRNKVSVFYASLLSAPFVWPSGTHSTWIARYILEGVVSAVLSTHRCFLAKTLPDKDPGSKKDNMDDLPALNLVGLAPICSLVFFLVPR